MRLVSSFEQTTGLQRRSSGLLWWRNRFTDNSEYSFMDDWKVESSLDEVAALFLDTPSLSDWWPQPGSVTVDEPGGQFGDARAFKARAKGFLPYALNLEFRVLSVQFPRQFAVEVAGDLHGEGGGSL